MARPEGKISDGAPASDEGALVISVPAAGRMLGLNRNAAYEAARRGEIPVLRFGNRLRVPKQKILAMLG